MSKRLKVFFTIRVEEIVQNVDLAPTFLDIAGVQVPPHMDGKSILPLVLNRHRSIKFKWPDTFLIESSGRRETPEQMAEQRAKAAAAKYSQLLNENNNKMEINLPENKTQDDLKQREHDFGSHEVEEDFDEDDIDDEEDNFGDSDVDTELQKDQPARSSSKKKRRNRECKKRVKILCTFFYFSVFQLPTMNIIMATTWTTTCRHTSRSSLV